MLDAAHITADVDPLGDPVVSNGMALCRLHHGAFDRFPAVRPDLTIEVRSDLLEEEDGPTEDRPSKDRLVRRDQGFLDEARKVS